MANDDYLTPKQAAKLIWTTPQHLKLLDEFGKGPPKRRDGERPYHRDDVLNYEPSLPEDLNDVLEMVNAVFRRA